MRDCDCQTCCEQCGHLDTCLRWGLLTDRPDIAAEVAAEDGYRLRRTA
ncbi:hypothetical protein [Streptomyces uncialis]|nr:hypothetical protein [Streptomyces uncialis]